MAFLSNSELHKAVEILSENLGFGRLCQRLGQLGAFVSRRRPASPSQLAERLYSLTGGLRRDIQPTYAFHTVWSETVSKQLEKEIEEKLEQIASRVNDCLTPKDSIAEGKTEELTKALGEYQELLQTKVGAEAARVDMLLKAVPEVADLVRRSAAPEADDAGSQPPPSTKRSS